MSGITTQNAQIRVFNETSSPGTWDDIACVTDFQGPTGSRTVIDTTCLDSSGREKNVGIPDYGQITFNIILSTETTDLHVGDTLALWDNFKDGTRQTFRIIIPNSPEDYIEFGAYVLNFQLTASGPDEVFRASVTLEIDGGVTDSF